MFLLISGRKSDYIHHCNTVKYVRVKVVVTFAITPLTCVPRNEMVYFNMIVNL